ncbi:porphobilinogen synthase [Pendulispora albinea]|uniref:Delta-aminolevulinic acid dehydratase n=1 Tax=Pendulispora albinea TaxID=2741071 RepID=A0ABZ2MD33_9BACT
MGFPDIRPRRLRVSPAMRKLVRETSLSPSDFIYPLFFSATLSEPNPIASLPGVLQLPVKMAAAQAREIAQRGIGSVILFGLPKTKDPNGDSAIDPDGPVPRAVAEIKSAVPDLLVVTDVCVDEYTDHGHCGVLRERKNTGELEVDNDATLDVLAKMAQVHARAGADIIAPSDMMDGRVARIRQALDQDGFESTAIMSYAVKYASAFYGPFRDVADCAPKFGDRAGYQMDPGNAREALREASLDEMEGADILMVKPALPYLDVLREVRRASNLPIAAYNVSGEYAMLHAAAAAKMIDLDRAMMEVLTSIRRAGADIILTYHALRAAELLGA